MGRRSAFHASRIGVEAKPLKPDGFPADGGPILQNCIVGGAIDKPVPIPANFHSPIFVPVDDDHSCARNLLTHRH
jgi:hypothetical protein